MKKNAKIMIGAGAAIVAGATVLMVPSAKKPAADPSTLTLTSNSDTTVYIAFGADSVIQSSAFTFCSGQPPLNCQFPMKAKSAQPMDLGGKYLNATISFGKPVGCGSTKAELNLNNPKWYDVTDISLVDGFDFPLTIQVTDSTGEKTLNVTSGSGNEKAFGVYPLGCDICVARQHPPCGQQPGKDGCKGGEQFKPDVPCQYQGPTMSGGSKVVVVGP